MVLAAPWIPQRPLSSASSSTCEPLFSQVLMAPVQVAKGRPLDDAALRLSCAPSSKISWAGVPSAGGLEL
jgi:hypothetical protein